MTAIKPQLNSDYAIETFSGQYVDTANPNPDTVDLHDIAHALSQTCRFGGHCKLYYSVAEHAVFVSRRIERRSYGLELQLAGLHHDDAEAYLGDIPRPMKPLLGAKYRELTNNMDRAINAGLDLPFEQQLIHDERIKDADNWSLFVEARYLLPSQGHGWWDGEQGSYRWDIHDLPSRIVTPDYWRNGLLPQEACELYLARHFELTERIKH